MRTLTFTIPGPPVGKERPRWRKGAKKPFTPPKTRAYEEQIGFFLLDAYPDIESVLTVCHLDVRHKRNMDGEEELEVTLIQTDDAMKPYGGADGDNILKSTADALQKAGAFRNDKQISFWSYGREL